MTYTVSHTDMSVEEQRRAFAALRENLGSASRAEIRRALEELREPGPPDPELTPEFLERYQRFLAAHQDAAKAP